MRRRENEKCYCRHILHHVGVLHALIGRLLDFHARLLNPAAVNKSSAGKENLSKVMRVRLNRSFLARRRINSRRKEKQQRRRCPITEDQQQQEEEEEEDVFWSCNVSDAEEEDELQEQRDNLHSQKKNTVTEGKCSSIQSLNSYFYLNATINL